MSATLESAAAHNTRRDHDPVLDAPYLAPEADDLAFAGDQRKRWRDVGDIAEKLLERLSTMDELLNAVLELLGPGTLREQTFVNLLDQHVRKGMEADAWRLCQIVNAVEQAHGWKSEPATDTHQTPAEALKAALAPLVALERLAYARDQVASIELAKDAIWQVHRAQRLLGENVHESEFGEIERAA